MLGYGIKVILAYQRSSNTDPPPPGFLVTSPFYGQLFYWQWFVQIEFHHIWANYNNNSPTWKNPEIKGDFPYKKLSFMGPVFGRVFRSLLIWPSPPSKKIQEMKLFVGAPRHHRVGFWRIHRVLFSLDAVTFFLGFPGETPQCWRETFPKNFGYLCFCFLQL